MIRFRIKQTSRFILPIAIIVIGIVLSVSVFIIVLDWEHQRIQTQFKQDAEERFEALKREIESDLHVLDSIQAFYTTHAHKIGRSEFRDFVKHFLLRYRSIQALGWIPRIPNNQRGAYEKAAQRDGFANFQITDRKTQGKMVRALQRKEYFPVYFVEAHKGNEIALGFDLGSDQTRLEALERSGDTGNMVATPRIKLVTTGQFGFLVFEPIYRKDVLTDSVESRREKLEGFALGVFRIGDIVKKSVSYLATKGIDFYLYDGSAPMQDCFLYFHQSGLSEAITTSRRSNEAKSEKGFQYARTLDVAGRRWTILYRPLPEYIAVRKTWQPLGVLLSGLLFTALCGSYLLINIKRTERIEKLVKERTDELSIANEELRHEITGRRQLEEAQRKSEERYRTLFEQSRDAVYITTQEGEILDVNESMLDLFGYSREEMLRLNARKTYVYPEDREKFRQEIERNGFVRDYEIKLRKKDGTEMDCLLTTTVRHADDGSILGYQGIIRDITKLKQILNELHTEKQRFQTLSENAPFGMVMIDKEGTFRYVNPKFRGLFGYDLNDVPDGRTWFRKAYPDPTYRHEVISDWISDLERTAPGERRARIFTVKCKDGSEKIVNILSVQLENCENLIACEDITERKKVEEALHQEKDFNQTLVQASPLFFVAIGPDGKTLMMNEAMLQGLGYTIDEVVGKDYLSTFVPVADREILLPIFQRLMNQKESTLNENRLLTKEGRELLVEWHGRPVFKANGDLDYFFGVGIDITERKRIEEHLLQSEKLRAVGEMANGVAHDFNNALASIIGNTQLLLFNAQDEELKETLRIIEQVAKDSSQTVRRLQDFTRSQPPQELFKVDINAIIKDSIEITKPKWKDEAQSRGIRIEMVSNLDDIPFASGNASELREVITNMIFNAVEALPGGGKIEIRTFKKRKDIFIQISDTGVGIAEEAKKKIFEPFFTTKPFINTGLGLSMSYGIVKRFGGEIEVESEVGQGTTFTISLPISEDEKEEAVDPQPIKNGIRARILVIDDEESVRSVLSRTLAQADHQVTLAEDGIKGVQLFKEGKFDLVLTDLGMPGMSGWEVCRMIKEMSPHTPVGMITGWGDERNRSKIEEYGLDFFISKPFDLAQILNAVAESMESRNERFLS